MTLTADLLQANSKFSEITQTIKQLIKLMLNNLDMVLTYNEYKF